MSTEEDQLSRNTAVMAVGTLLSRVTGVGRWAALSYSLGATTLTDTYWLANNTPNIIYELALGGVLSGTLLPAFVRAFRSDDDEDRGGWEAVSALVTVAVVASAVLALVFLVVAPLFVSLYTLRNSGQLAAEQRSVAVDMVRLFAPQVFFYGLISVSTALLNARRRFAAPMFAPVLNNLLVIGVLVAFPHVTDTTTLAGVRADRGALLFLGLGTTAGVFVMALAQLPVRTLVRHVRWRWQPDHPAVRTVIRLSGWTVAFVLANQISLFLVYFLANGRGGDVTIYGLALPFFQLPHGIIAVSIMSAIAPDLAALWADDDVPGFRRRLVLGIRTISAVMVPAAVGYILLARPIVGLVLDHGRLAEGDADDLGRTLALMAIGLPAYSLWLYFTRAYQALQDTRSLFVLYVVENAVNIAAALALYPSMGVEGLGLAYALAYIIGSGAALVDLRRRLGGLEGRDLGTSLARIAVATAVMAGAVAVVAPLVGTSQGAGAAARAGVATVVGVTVYLVAARAIGVAELRSLLSFRRRS